MRGGVDSVSSWLWCLCVVVLRYQGLAVGNPHSEALRDRRVFLFEGLQGLLLEFVFLGRTLWPLRLKCKLADPKTTTCLAW